MGGTWDVQALCGLPVEDRRRPHPVRRAGSSRGVAHSRSLLSNLAGGVRQAAERHTALRQGDLAGAIGQATEPHYPRWGQRLTPRWMSAASPARGPLATGGGVLAGPRAV